MNDRTGSRHCLRHLRATKSVERFDLEMFAQREDRLLGQKRVAVILERVIDFADFLLLFQADQQFGWRNASDFVEQRLAIL